MKSKLHMLHHTPSTSYPDQIRPALVKTWRKTRRSACLVFVAHAQNGLTARHPTWPWRARTARTASTARSSPSGCHILSETFQESCRNSRNSSIISIVSSKGKRLKQHRLTHTMNRYEKKIKEGGHRDVSCLSKTVTDHNEVAGKRADCSHAKRFTFAKIQFGPSGITWIIYPDSKPTLAHRQMNSFLPRLLKVHPPKHCITQNSKVQVKLFQDSIKIPQEWHESLGLLCTA